MIYQKLLEVQKVGISVSKDGTNPHFKSKYMTLDNIIETSNPILTKAGLVVTHYCRDGMVHTKIVDTDKDGGDVESSFPLAE
jgi:hypothetical protein